MSLSPGTHLGPYEILAALGAGGMGEVYRAHDTKLNRDVALKILPPEFTHDPDRVARFRREAQVLAAVNHPHIAAIYGLEDEKGSQFLVLELVEGETLTQRLKAGPLPLDEVLTVARQIVEALEAAHEKGIIHRDLKPANIAFIGDGQVRVLDFGLAKAMETAPEAANLTHSPTLSIMATQAGVILGTAAYMSPEQAKGLPTDARSDLFSFGVVLSEMLVGRAPFQGETAPDVLASVVAREADLSALPADLSPRLVEALQRCLEKNPKRRWQAAGDLRADLDAIARSPRATALVPALAPVAVQRLSRRTLALGAMLLVLATALAGSAGWMLRSSPAPAPPAPTARFTIALPEGQQFTNTGRHVLAISPDGTKIVYVANQRLYLRSLGELEARPIAGTESWSGVMEPVFSPDGLTVFVQPLPSTGAKYQVPNVALRSANGLWAPDGKELFFATNAFQLFVVSVVTQPSFRFGNPVKLPSTAKIQVGNPATPRPYDITPDGKILGVAFGTSEPAGPRRAADAVGEAEEPDAYGDTAGESSARTFGKARDEKQEASVTTHAGTLVVHQRFGIDPNSQRE